MKDNVHSFLMRHCIHPQSVDMDTVIGLFRSDMNAGLAGRNSSLAMIPAYCSPDCRVEKGQSVIVIDAGGTNLRTCLVNFDDDMKPVISDFRKRSMPGIDKEVSSDEFFDIFADEVECLIEKSNRIGFCFSYAAKILPDHDGIPIMFSKEIKAPQVIGMRIGKGLLETLAKRGHDVSDKKIFICNDTVATLLAGLSVSSDKYDGCIGFILGTGTNTAYIESSANISKDGYSGTGSQIINMESGNMDICLGDIDRAFLDSTACPEKYHFEKMISGAYIGHLACMIIAKAVEEGLFSASFASAFGTLDKLSTAQVSFFLEGVPSELDSCIGCESDRETLTDILVSHFCRSAKLASCNLASAVLASGAGKDRPILINADGTTFYKTFGLEENTKKYLSEYLASKGISADFTCIENSPVIGSAMGALSI